MFPNPSVRGGRKFGKMDKMHKEMHGDKAPGRPAINAFKKLIGERRATKGGTGKGVGLIKLAQRRMNSK